MSAITPATFEDGYGFPLDPFQGRAVDALLAGRSVLVAAPTGAGKTVVGEFACWAALDQGTKCFYTTPIKALSNQKYRDLVVRHGASNVGLLTGDRSVNGEASVVVMTTEVLRNMIYEASPTLRGLRFVVLDEVHYLGDRERGATWEEVIVQLPASVQIAALSATVSNAEEFADWLAGVRDGCAVVIEDGRPVPLRHHYFLNDRVYPTFAAGRKQGASAEHRERAAQALAGVPNPDVVMLERRARTRNRVTQRGRRLPPDTKLRWPSRARVVEELRERNWLPAILFVFSRQGCDDAVTKLVREGIRLTSASERDELGAIADAAVAGIPQGDLAVLGFDAWRDALLHGIAAHHAGLVPAFKEAVELAFQRGLLRVVVATETLALGINMPAKSVVIERLEKWDGERHTLLTPGQYTQLTGRAGRRGIDRVGHAVVLYQRDIDFRTVAGLVGTRAYPLESSFRPSYNMAVNLLRRHTREQAETLLGASFAQFQADRSVAGSGARLVELEEGMRGYARHLTCHRGAWEEYWSLRRQLEDLEQETAKARDRDHDAAVQAGLAALQPGDVVHAPWAPRRGLVAVVGVHLTKRGDLLADVVTEDRALRRMGARELDGPPAVAGRVALPDRGNARQRDYRAVIASRLRHVDPPAARPVAPAPQDDDRGDELRDLRRAVERHPCHACEDREDHARWQRRSDELDVEARKLRRSIQRRTGSLVREFERILDVLVGLGYVDEGDRPTEEGLRLAGIYSEADLLVAEVLRASILDGLDAPELAGLAALFVYEPRGGELTAHPELPTAAVAAAVERVEALAAELRSRERGAGLTPLRDLDAGFVAAAWRWAHGLDLGESVGSDADLTGGDFVRNVKQVADLLGQIRDVGSGAVRAAAHAAIDDLRRGIVEA